MKVKSDCCPKCGKQMNLVMMALKQPDGCVDVLESSSVGAVTYCTECGTQLMINDEKSFAIVEYL